MAIWGVVRHKKFDECIASLSAVIPRLAEAIEGAIYSISRQPEKDGVQTRLPGPIPLDLPLGRFQTVSASLSHGHLTGGERRE